MGVLAYLILSINIYLESQAFGVFRLGYSRIGPTEARIVLVAANVALAVSGPSAAVIPVATGTPAAFVIGMFVLVGTRIGRNLSRSREWSRFPPPCRLPPHRVHRGQRVHEPCSDFPQRAARQRARHLCAHRRGSLVVDALGRASARHEETVIRSVLESAPLLTCVAEPRGGDEQLGLEAGAELPIDDLDAVRRRPEELAELDTEGEAVGLVEIGHKGGVGEMRILLEVVEWR